MGCEQSSTKDATQPTHVSRYPCPFCPQQFTEDKKGSLAHQAAGCSGSKVRCPDCFNFECKHQLDLSEHRRKKHPSNETLLCPSVEVIQGSEAPSFDCLLSIRRDALVFLDNSGDEAPAKETPAQRRVRERKAAEARFQREQAARMGRACPQQVTENSVLREIPVGKVDRISIRDHGTRLYIQVKAEDDLLLQPEASSSMTMDAIVEALKASCRSSGARFVSDPTHLDPDTLRLGELNPVHNAEYNCGCGESFSSLSLLDDHRDRGGCSETVAKCNNCAVTFPSQFLLHKHHSTPSCATPTTRCDSCDLDDIPVDKFAAHLISDACSALSAAVTMARGNSMVVNTAASQRMARKLLAANKKLSKERELNKRGACERAQLTADLDRLQQKVTTLVEKSQSPPPAKPGQTKSQAMSAETKRARMEQQQALRDLATAQVKETKALRAEIDRQKKRISVLETGKELQAMKEAERELEEEALRQGDYIAQLKEEANVAEKKAEAAAESISELLTSVSTAEAEMASALQAAKEASAKADIQFQISEGLHRLAAEFGRGRGKPFCLVNPVMTTSHSAASFFKGVSDLGYATLGELLNHPAHYSVGFHGTKTEAALLSILEGGFDTNRRSVQALGPGEYFDTGTGAIAAQYAGDTDCLIVALLVKKARNGDVVAVFTEHKNHRIGSATSDVTVVENPKQGAMSFNLPIAVVSSSDYSLRRIRHQVRDYNFQAPRKVATPYQKEQLFFQNHSGNWLPQCDQVQRQAADALRNHRKVFDTGKIQVLGYNGDPITFEYSIDLEKMTQRNKDTQVERALRWVGKTTG